MTIFFYVRFLYKKASTRGFCTTHLKS